MIFNFFFFFFTFIRRFSVFGVVNFEFYVSILVRVPNFGLIRIVFVFSSFSSSSLSSEDFQFLTLRFSNSTRQFWYVYRVWGWSEHFSFFPLFLLLHFHAKIFRSRECDFWNLRPNFDMCANFQVNRTIFNFVPNFGYGGRVYLCRHWAAG